MFIRARLVFGFMNVDRLAKEGDAEKIRREKIHHVFIREENSFELSIRRWWSRRYDDYKPRQTKMSNFIKD